MANLKHCFLLRHPRDVLLSYSQKREDTGLSDIGIVEQQALFSAVTELQGQAPLIIDSSDFLDASEAYLRAICTHLDIKFYPSMLSWPAGRRDSDGVWGDHWYANVWQSTGFSEQRRSKHSLDSALSAVLEQALPAYETLRQHCLIL